MRATGLLGVFGFIALASIASAFELPRTANLVFDTTVSAGRYALPTGPLENGALPLTALDGQVTRRAWQIPQTDATALRLFQGIRDQLIADGAALIFQCSARTCGGFDFRYAVEVLEAPAMFVDLGAYHFASFSGQTSDAHLSLLVSKGGTTGYVQLIDVRAQGTQLQSPSASVQSSSQAGLLASEMALGEKLAAVGATILDDLEFATGADTLTDGSFASLEQLAAFLTAQPEARVVLVGHTDATGSLERNIALSKRRAEAVQSRLIERYRVQAAQVTAEGVGFLSPRATNITEDGRNTNRRVEVVLISAS
jgi:OOP family OmpA-OmpF porin